MKTLLALAFISITLTACNTVEGIGEDVQTLGSKIEKTAK